MPNYSDTIVKLFVRDELKEIVPQIVLGLASEDMAREQTGEGDDRTWLDFERLLPSPKELYEEGRYDSAAGTVLEGRWPPHVDMPQGAGDSPKEMIEAFRSISPEHAACVDRIAARLERWGVTGWYEWRNSKWGTKWNSSCDEPRIESADDYDGYDDFPGATMIHYRMTTAWSEPSGYLAALQSVCVQFGLGMRCWATHEDGGTEWDPVAEEYRTRWERLHSYDVELEEMSHSDMLALMGGGLEIMPDESASTPVKGNDPMEIIRRALR